MVCPIPISGLFAQEAEKSKKLGGETQKDKKVKESSWMSQRAEEKIKNFCVQSWDGSWKENRVVITCFFSPLFLSSGIQDFVH